MSLRDLDFGKAYNKGRWEFLEVVLKEKGFLLLGLIRP
jgi:hypothetical protein